MKLSDKLGYYEQVLHDLHFAAEVTMNERHVRKLLSNISRWSYSHRAGNGELSDKEQKRLIDEATKNLSKTD